MVLELQFVRKAYTQVLAHQMKRVLRVVRQYPHDRFDQREPACGQTARELAEGCVARLRRIDAIACGDIAPLPPLGPCTRGTILLDLETSYLSAHSALLSLPAAHWSEVVTTPPGLRYWMQARRGELLWLALREMARHQQHLASHMRCECQGDGTDGGARSHAVREAELDLVAAGA